MAKITLEINATQTTNGPALEGQIDFEINDESQRELSDVMALKLLDMLNSIIPHLSDEVLALAKDKANPLALPASPDSIVNNRLNIH